MIPRTYLASLPLVAALGGCSMVAQLSGHSSTSPSSSPSSSGSPYSSSSSSSPSSSSGGGETAADEGCKSYLYLPSYITLWDIKQDSRTKLESVFALMRCPDSKVGGEEATAYGEMRSWIRSQLDTGLYEAPPLLRVAYADMCARELVVDDRPYPAAAIGCAWQVDRIDLAKANAALAALPDGGKLREQLAKDIKTVHARVEQYFPKGKAAREWEVFYEIPSRVLKEANARRAANASAYAKIAAFDAGLANGKFEGCADPLRKALASHLKGPATQAALVERLTDPVGYALADALARCHYYSEDELKAGVIVQLLSRARRQVSIAEQIYFAQIDALAIDEPKARKFPNLGGSKYSKMVPSDLRPIQPYTPTEMEKNWYSKQYELANQLGVVDGRVERLVPGKGGVTIYFKKERVPLVQYKCHETDKIDTITDEGKIKYREVCTTKPMGMTWSRQEPVTVDEATGVTPGRYVHLEQDGGKTVVGSATDGPSEDARVFRLADVVLSGR
jgi:hypothetical protein